MNEILVISFLTIYSNNFKTFEVCFCKWLTVVYGTCLSAREQCAHKAYRDDDMCVTGEY